MLHWQPRLVQEAGVGATEWRGQRAAEMARRAIDAPLVVCVRRRCGPDVHAPISCYRPLHGSLAEQQWRHGDMRGEERLPLCRRYTGLSWLPATAIVNAAGSTTAAAAIAVSAAAAGVSTAAAVVATAAAAFSAAAGAAGAVPAACCCAATAAR